MTHLGPGKTGNRDGNRHLRERHQGGSPRRLPPAPPLAVLEELLGSLGGRGPAVLVAVQVGLRRCHGQACIKEAFRV